jgi:hypothetical protein
MILAIFPYFFVKKPRFSTANLKFFVSNYEKIAQKFISLEIVNRFLAFGKYIHLSLYQVVDGVKIFEGNLISFDLQTLTLDVLIKTNKKRITVERKNIAKARLTVKF